MRVALLVRSHLDELQHLPHARPDRLPLQLPHLEREREVLEDRHVRPDGVGLEDDPEVALLGGDGNLARHVDESVVADGDPPGLGMLEAGDRHQRRRLAAAARPEQREELALLDREADVVERALVAELLDEVLHVDLRHRALLP